MKEHPIIIVGAGPACAKVLKDENIEALIINHIKLCREKIILW
jgi:predicted flavoprotein YhiN